MSRVTILSVQKQLAKNSLLDVAYVGNHGLQAARLSQRQSAEHHRRTRGIHLLRVPTRTGLQRHYGGSERVPLQL